MRLEKEMPVVITTQRENTGLLTGTIEKEMGQE